MSLPQQDFQEYYQEKLDRALDEDLEQYTSHKPKGLFKKIVAWISFSIGLLSYLCAMLGIFTVSTVGLQEDDLLFISAFFVVGFLFEAFAGKHINLKGLALKIINTFIGTCMTILTFLTLMDYIINGFYFDLPAIIAKIAYVLITLAIWYRHFRYHKKIKNY